MVMRSLCVSCNNYRFFSIIIANSTGRETEPNLTYCHRRVVRKVFFVCCFGVPPPAQCYREIQKDLTKLLKSIKEELQSWLSCFCKGW